MSWENVINLNVLQYKSAQAGSNYKCETAPLAKLMGAKKLGFHAEILPPGSFSCPYHFHHSEEELFLALEGEAILRQADQFKKVSQGDLIFFSNTPEGAHQFYNHSDRPFRFLALSTNDDFEVVEYPDSKKVSVIKVRKTFQAGQTVDYWLDESDPKNFWPQEYLKK